MIYARPGQSLKAHTESVAKMAAKFGKKIGIEELARIAGMLHDVGKNTDEFQAYLKKETLRHEGGHSRYGAKYVYDLFPTNKRAAEILSNVILSHHGALYDHIDAKGHSELLSKVELAPPIDLSNLDINFTVNSTKILEEIRDYYAKSTCEKSFMASFLIKYTYSCLVDADRLDAYHDDNDTVFEEKKIDWSDYIAKLEAHIRLKETSTEMGIIREKISEECAIAGEKERGIYKLEVGTGGGKTLSSLRFALEHAKKHDMERVIYIIPYLSIIDQTEEEFQNLFGRGVVLGHHSNAELIRKEDESEEDAENRYKFQTSRWDSPIIITTMVQFLESAFSSRGSDLRKLHNMANSVIIFDEIQSLPIKCIHLFNGLGNFLKNICGSTLLLCSATQPLIDDANAVERPIELTQGDSIVQTAVPNRTKITNQTKPNGYSADELADFVAEKFERDSLLVIVNTKKVAKECYEEIRNRFSEDTNIVHLSTSMCKKHREEKFDLIKDCLGFDKETNSYIAKNKKPVIVISTQLIEAGVDLSFKCVIRSLAGLDSINQAAGRCNRHGEYGEPMPVYVLNLSGENLEKMPEIQIGADVTVRVFNEGGNMNDFYKYYLHEQKEKMDYATSFDEKITIYELLSTNTMGSYSYKNEGNKVPIKLPQAMRTAGDEFYTIDKGQVDVIVSHGEAEKLLESFDESTDIKEKIKILKQLGQYSVGLYAWQLEKLESVISGHETGILRLSETHYNDEYGVNFDAKLGFLNF